MNRIARTSLNWVAYLPALLFIVVVPAWYFLIADLGAVHFENFLVHSTLESIGAVTSIMLAILPSNWIKAKNKSAYTYVLLGFLAMGILDIFHSVANPGEGFVYYHSFSVFLGGLFFFLVWVPSGRILLKETTRKIAGAFLFCLVSFAILFLHHKLPQSLINQQFTLFPSLLNYIGGLFFMLASIKFLIDFFETKSRGLLVLAIIAILLGISALMFKTPALWSDLWWFWHLVRFFGFILVFSLILSLFLFTLSELQVTLQEKEEANKELSLINEEYQALNEEFLTTNEELKDQTIKLYDLNAELEEALEQANQSDQLKKQFLANISHEIRTPVNVISGFTALLQEETDPEAKMRSIHLIDQASVRLSDVVDAIITISLLESDQLSFEKVHFSPKELIEKTVSNLRFSPLLSQRPQVHLEIVPSDDSSKKAYNDPYRTGQVLNELILNGLKFSNQGTVRISYEWLEEETETKLLFRISDEGIGISPEKQSLVFNKFTKFNSSFQESGVGLGLSIAKQLIEKMGGTIGFESTPEIGSVFYFTLPA